MAFLYKRAGSANWYVRFELPDGTPKERSTKTTSRKQAEVICATLDRTLACALKGVLTVDRAREVITAGVQDIYLAAHSEQFPDKSIRDYAKTWLASKAIEATASTHNRYQYAVQHWLTYLGPRAERPISIIATSDLLEFRNHLAKVASANTVNLTIKVLRALFSSAVMQNLVTRNPASAVKKVPLEREGVRRRPFQVPEIQRVLAAAKDSDWYGMVLLGLYTGGRLSDLAALTWRNIDLDERKLVFTAQKTGKHMELPLIQVAQQYLTDRASTDNLDELLFPELDAKSVSQLSDGFRDLLVVAGLAKPRPHNSQGKGRNALRQMSDLSFHSLRHSFVSMLKKTGATDAIAKELAGHATDSVSRVYTHFSSQDLQQAVDRMPDVTNTVQLQARSSEAATAKVVKT